MTLNLNTFRRSLFHSVTAPPDQIRNDLARLRELDLQTERKLTRFRTLIPWAVGLGVVFFFASAVLFSFVTSNPGFIAAFPSDLLTLLLVVFSLCAVVCWTLPFFWKKLDLGQLSNLGLWFLILALASAGLLFILQFPLFFLNPAIVLVALIAGLVILLTLRFKTSTLNLPNYRYELADQIISLFSRDMDMTSKASLKILFKKQVDRPEKTIPHPRRAGWKVDICDNEWLKIKGPLLNGNWVQISLTERYRKRYGRNINGKWREKYQQRGLEIKLGIRVPKRRYADLAQLQGKTDRMIRLPSTATLKQLTLSGNLLKMKVLIPNWLGGAQTVSMIWPQEPSEDAVRQVYQVILMMMLSAFQILNFAHLLSRPKTA